MAKFLVDVNLPYYFSLWNSEDYIHQKDIDDEWTDEQIWEYARLNGLTIITKDSDFSNKILMKNPPPKVIHIRVGNVNMRSFFKIITSCWPTCMELAENHKLVNVFEDRIEGIN